MHSAFKRWLAVVAVKVLIVVVSMIIEIIKDSGEEASAV